MERENIDREIDTSYTKSIDPHNSIPDSGSLLYTYPFHSSSLSLSLSLSLLFFLYHSFSLSRGLFLYSYSLTYLHSGLEIGSCKRESANRASDQQDYELGACRCSYWYVNVNTPWHVCLYRSQ